MLFFFQESRLIIRRFFLLFLCLLLTKAAFPSSNSSLETLFSIDSQKISIRDVFKYIESKSEYSFWVDTDNITLNEEISISFENKSVKQILDSVLKGRNLSYEIKGKHIIIKPINKKEHTKEAPTTEQSKERTLVGKIKDAITGELIAGANIMIKGTTIGTLSDADGNFILNIPKEEPATLVVSFIGYFSKEIAVGNKDNITIEMQIKAEELEEVQVVAYGAQKKVTITGAISSIDTKSLVKSPSASVGNILAGAVSGVSSVQVSGRPGGEDPEIFVRGTGSLSVDASRPLILVDGVERSFFQMDPNEIENITVLKDASATAVFGVKGANGVILVTTRRGEKGKASISVTSSAGLTHSIRHLDIVDSYNHALLYSEAELNDNPSLKPEELTFNPFVTQMFKEGKDPVFTPDEIAALIANL